ncbi:unnamed protein product [Allacma fusca]|uniref:Uncharacterized protein n=1 Tax=Allacma fusca TaxID=39272 RepID=A0A8J2PP46_9HEXA|nr:unnamed protein product [Allacma fusca]
MNQWRVLFCGGILFLIHLMVVRGSGEIRQRSDGCGRNPLIALASAFGSGSLNLNDVLRAVKADPDVWSEMQVLLRRYDDCIRAGDGLHYKRNLGMLFPLVTTPPNPYIPLGQVEKVLESRRDEGLLNPAWFTRTITTNFNLSHQIHIRS